MPPTPRHTADKEQLMIAPDRMTNISLRPGAVEYLTAFLPRFDPGI
jgi:hypothetical protein